MDHQQDHQQSGQDGRQNGDQGSQATSHNSSPFGRGWIPLSRDIGIPGERLARNQRYFDGEGDAATGGAGGFADSGALDGVGADCRRLGEWVAYETADGVFGASASGSSAAHPQPLPQAGGGLEGASDASTSYKYWTAERQVRFLAFLAENGRVRHACARVGMSFQSAYVLRRRDAAFAQGWDAAMVLARDHAERVLADRAIDGVVETVWYRGEAVGHRRRFDSRLLLAHLARLDGHARSSSRGQAVAGRFDDYLAAILAGEADPAERAPVFQSFGQREWPAQGWRPLDPDRPSAIMEAMREAESALTDDIESLRAEAADALCEGLPLGDRPAKQAIEDAVLDRLRAAADEARAVAAAQWDAAFAERTAGLDALVPPYAEDDGEDAREGGDAVCGDGLPHFEELPEEWPAAGVAIEVCTQTPPAEFKSISGFKVGKKSGAAKTDRQTQMGARIAPGPQARSPLASHDFAFDHRGPAPDCFRGTKPLAAVETGRSEPHEGPSPGRSRCRLHLPSGFTPWAGHVADRSPVLKPEPSAIRGPVRNAALRLQADLVPCGMADHTRRAGRHRRSTGLAAWDGR